MPRALASNLDVFKCINVFDGVQVTTANSHKNRNSNQVDDSGGHSIEVTELHKLDI